jgi:hypothetical protein
VVEYHQLEILRSRGAAAEQYKGRDAPSHDVGYEMTGRRDGYSYRARRQRSPPWLKRRYRKIMSGLLVWEMRGRRLGHYGP